MTGTAEKIDILSMTREELETLFKSLSLERFRAAQVFRWLHKTPVTSFSEMTNLSLALREKLNKQTVINCVRVEKKLVSSIDGTVKYLYRLADGQCVESVLMRYEHGLSICISTEVGCKMGCSFCASTKAGFVRPLTTGEMLSEIYTAEQDLGEKVGSVVLMGIGEPLDNYDNVLRFLKMLSSPDGRELSLRHVSLSTCGIVPKIDELAMEKLQLTLSVSLHAAFENKRDRLMPVNRTYPLKMLMAACRRYVKVTGRRVSFEYILIDGVNDTPADAAELAKLLRGMQSHVNLIPANGVREWEGKGSPRARAAQFERMLSEKGVAVTIRRTMGGDIDAACGQLRRERDEKKGGAEV